MPPIAQLQRSAKLSLSRLPPPQPCFGLTEVFLPPGCPAGRYGQDCAGLCSCGAGVPCDPVTGDCVCPPGRAGPACEQGKYGPWGRASGLSGSGLGKVLSRS